MDCPSCALKIETRVKTLAGVEEAAASAVTGALKVTHDGSVGPESVAAAVEAAGYHVRRATAANGHAGTPGRAHDSVEAGASEFRRRLILAGASGTLLILGFATRWAAASGARASASWLFALVTSLFLLSMVLGGWLVGRQAFQALTSRVVNFEVLVVIAALGATAIGDLPEAALVVFLFSVGETLEAVGVTRTRRAISSLLDLVPRTALVRRNGAEEEVPAAEVAVGDLVIVRPGERIPIDGRVAAGRSFVNQAPVTGESMPVGKAPGDDLFAGTINGAGVLEVMSTHRPNDSTLARVVHLVEEAQLVKARRQKLVDRFAASYTPAVVGLAVAIGVLPPLILGRPFEPFIYRALALLLVACPCAMVLSTPVAVVASIGSAARRGVLIKGGLALESIGQVRAVAFDKTGTLTVGRPEVSDVFVADPTGPGQAAATGPGQAAATGPGQAAATGPGERELLALAAAIESRSEHPLADAIRRRHAEMGEALSTPVRNFEAIPGRGAKARVGDRNHYVGSEALFQKDLGLDLGPLATVGADLEKRGKTVVYVGTSTQVLGLIAVSDTVRAEAGQAVAALRGAGVERVYLLTGDNPATARAVAEALGLDGYRAGLLPADKVAAVKELGRDLPLAMVGDGVNDAPALAAAGVGVAMGVAGTDLAIEAADIALMSDDLGRVAYAIRLGRRAAGVIRQNIAVALAIKLVALALATIGFLPLWLAILADTGNTVLVILNGLRLLGGVKT
jgi:Cd2+/Zn2+-exporting ATPase